MHDAPLPDALPATPPALREADDRPAADLDEVVGGATDDGAAWQAYFFEAWASDSL